MKFNDFINSPTLPKGYQRIKIEGLLISTGLIVSGDPFNLPSATLSTKIPSGKYLIELIYKDCLEWGFRVAFAALIISTEHVKRWKSVENEQGFDRIFVDSGLACFVDSDTARSFSLLIDEWRTKIPPKNYYDLILKKEICKKVLQGDRVNRFGLHHPFNNEKNIAIFECGVGDGAYKTYCGMDNNNKLSVILIDFDILNWV